MKLTEAGTVYASGAAAYGLTELLFRGHTHWTMPLTGGLCFLLFHLRFAPREHASLTRRCLGACGIITALELAVGWLVNLRLGWRVWDYSHQLFNLRGQICLLFSGFWFLMGLPMSFASRRIHVLFCAAPRRTAAEASPPPAAE